MGFVAQPYTRYSVHATTVHPQLLADYPGSTAAAIVKAFLQRESGPAAS